MKLAIVDDNPAVRTALGRLLRIMGHEVQEFDSAEEFEADGADVDCAVVDVRMPGVGGLELVRRLKLRDVPIPAVLISGDTSLDAGYGASSCDVPYLAKPFDDSTLMAAISEAIASRENSNGA